MSITVESAPIRPLRAPAAWRPVDLTIIVPTFNERDNVASLVGALDAALAGVSWEVVFVDDNSPDGTAETVRGLARLDPRVRCLQRIGRRGLASACVEGALSSSAPYVAVIDGDLQHDEALLPTMLAAMKAEALDLAVGSRYLGDGGVGDWSKGRARASRFATRLTRAITRTALSDPMSGFFMIRRDLIVELAPRLSSIGFKILLDLFASAPRPLKHREFAYQFRARTHGDSKFDLRVLWEFGMMLIDKTVGSVIPARLVSFVLIGGMGVFVHMAALLALQAAGLAFIAAHAVATFVAMTFNFFLNNMLTYADQRLKGTKLLIGWATFVLACSFGAAANVGVAGYLFSQDQFWAVSALAGIAVGTVWNFAVTSAFTWRRK